MVTYILESCKAVLSPASMTRNQQRIPKSLGGSTQLEDSETHLFFDAGFEALEPRCRGEAAVGHARLVQAVLRRRRLARALRTLPQHLRHLLFPLLLHIERIILTHQLNFILKFVALTFLVYCTSLVYKATSDHTSKVFN